MTVKSANFGAGGSYYCMSLPMLDMKPRCERCDTLLPDEELAFICADLAREAKMGGLSLRLPESLHRKLREVAESEGVSINQWISSAVAEKMSALMTEEYLGARAKRGSR